MDLLTVVAEDYGTNRPMRKWLVAPIAHVARQVGFPVDVIILSGPNCQQSLEC